VKCGTKGEMRLSDAYHPLAIDELLSIERYLEDSQKALALEFRAEFDEAVIQVLEFPESASLVSPLSIRRRIFSRLQYRFFYVVEDSYLVILSVKHRRQLDDWTTHYP